MDFSLPSTQKSTEDSQHGLELLSSAALKRAIASVDSQAAYEASKILDSSQVCRKLDCLILKLILFLHLFLKDIFSSTGFMSQEYVHKLNFSQKIKKSSQSYQQSSDFDINSISPDENSSDHQVLKLSSQEIFTNDKKISVDDYYKKSKKEKRLARKQTISPKKLDKRERNRIAAQKLREKRKQEKEEIKNAIKYWEKEVSLLKNKWKQLCDQKDRYLNLLPTLKLDEVSLKKVEGYINSLDQTD